jgi:hypothetical protein
LIDADEGASQAVQVSVDFHYWKLEELYKIGVFAQLLLDLYYSPSREKMLTQAPPPVIADIHLGHESCPQSHPLKPFYTPVDGYELR